VEAWKTSRSVRIFERGPWRFAVLLAAGGALAVAIGVVVPEVIWPGAWRSFAANIGEHTHYLFSNHFGWSKVAAFYPQQGEVVFSNLTPRIFADWSAAMLLRTHWPFFIVSAFVVWALMWIFSPLRLPAEPAICLMGLSLIFFEALPAHYYLTMLLPIGAVFTSKKLPLPIVCAFWLLWVACSVVTMQPENLGWAFGYNLAALPLAALGGFMVSGRVVANMAADPQTLADIKRLTDWPNATDGALLAWLA
jgi:hypothetical protein